MERDLEKAGQISTGPFLGGLSPAGARELHIGYPGWRRRESQSSSVILKKRRDVR